MTNLIVLGVAVITNFYSYQVCDNSKTNIGANGWMTWYVETKSNVCCVTTITDIGITNGTYLFSTGKTDRRCDGITAVHSRDWIGYVSDRAKLYAKKEE